MPLNQSGEVGFYTFDSFSLPGLTHAVFTRRGGVSDGQWTSLNVGLTQGDDPERVAENRRISFRAAGRPIETLSDSWLIHGTGVYIYDSPRPPDRKIPPQADIILTDKPQVTLFMRYADCTPILLHDPIKKVIGLAHAGWQGTVKRVGGAAVEAMQARYGSRPEDILAGIGPSIGPHIYEVGQDVVEAVQDAFGPDASEFLPEYNRSTHFDLWAANRYVLAQAGVKHIEVSGVCTGSDVGNWFSHRVEKGLTGRFGALLGLNDR